MKRWERWAVGLFLAILTLEGALRFALNQVGLAQLVYLKDAVAILVVLAGVVRHLEGRDVNPGFVSVIAFLCLYSLISLARGTAPGAIAFGAKIFLPMALGALAFRYLAAKEIRPLVTLLWVVAVAGVALNYMISFPWVGMVYDVGDVEVSASKAWSAFGFSRLSGFSRGSVHAAAQLTFFWLVAFSYRHASVRAAAWLVTAGALFLTTSKGLMLSFAAMGAASILLYSRFGRFTLRMGLVSISLAVIGLPLLAGPAISHAVFQGNIGPLSLYSLGVRLREMWPYQFETLAQYDAPWLGMGFGYVGTAAAIYGGELLPGDNIFVYLYFIAGAAGAVLLLGLSLQIAKLTFLGPRHFMMYLVGLAIFVNGAVSNVFENTLCCLFLGCLLGHLGKAPGEAGATMRDTAHKVKPRAQRWPSPAGNGRSRAEEGSMMD